MATRIIRSRARSLIVFTVLLALLALSAVGLSSCGSTTQGPSKEVQDKLSKAVDAAMAEYGIPGAIIGVWIPGKGQWTATKGKADIKTGAAPQLGDHMRIGSISKTFTATVILQLVDEGKLTLDDTINKFDLGLSVPNADKITVRNLLNMTSGLFNYTADTEAFWVKFYTDPKRVWTPKELVDISIAHGAVAAPGGAYDYCNTNYILLGMIMEKVTGSTAQKLITTRIIDKLGLKNTSFPMDSSMPTPFMHGYSIEITGDMEGPATRDISIESPTAFWTAGGMISNMADVKTWVNAIATGKLISPAMHAEQLKFSAPNTESYGLGVMNGRRFVGHSGEVPGYNSSAYTETGGGGTTLIVLLNRYPSKIEGVSDTILAALIKALSAEEK